MEEIKGKPPVSSAAEQQIRFTGFSLLPLQVPFKFISSVIMHHIFKYGLKLHILNDAQA